MERAPSTPGTVGVCDSGQMSFLCHGWQATFGGGCVSTDMFGNLRKRWSDRSSASVWLGKPRAQSGHLELIAPATQVSSGLCQSCVPADGSK